MKPMIDIHSHILPGVDDGCPDREQALAMLRMYEEQGAEAVICTPHFGICARKGADVEGAFRWLCSLESPVKLYIGNEILLTRYTLQDVRRGIARRMAGSDRILIEFDEWSRYSATQEEITEGLRWAGDSEFRPILAHAERYKCLRENPELYRRIAESGAEIQINAYSICEETNPDTVSAARFLLENRLVSYIGSDAHGETRRPPRLQKGVQWIYDHCPEEYADAVVHDNAWRLLNEECRKQPEPGVSLCSLL